jgi:hypothetical protein
MSDQLRGTAHVLSGRETGLHEIHDTEVASQIALILARAPEVGSLQKADELIDCFRRTAVKLAGACQMAAYELNELTDKGGRPPLVWHNDFTALLVSIAETVGVEPRLSKGRISDQRAGWLFDAAQALEAFLDPRMRSPTTEACGKRLDRSLKTIKQQHRQNLPSA